MKHFLITLVALLLTGPALYAQGQQATVADTITLTRADRPGLNPGFVDGGALHKDKKKSGKSISIGSGGVHYDNGNHDTSYHRFAVQFGMLDLGINSLVDHTSYPEPSAASVVGAGPNNFLMVDAAHNNADLFSLRQSKSINVNIYPIMLRMGLYHSPRQDVTLATGIGFQLYNFRFTKPVTYHADPSPYVALDTVAFSKNKLAFNYLTVPLMLNAKTRLGTPATGKNALWLVYGAGVSGGYLLSSWTKQISDERGKEKNHDPFNFNKTNLCVNGELGLDGYFRLYASYQLTALHDGYLDQHPFCIGIRFLGL
jgi:hypothetical protein